ncbi:hypothetical protein VNO78_04651 [Psophocarpus tetragonolobus]|uniref:Core Histone H2A/H2B/H3 domain-containing protein n=1 Tax=Psophocarpus tetragonolobus TaxID=3891 RepID=A0AAN9T2P0_PSOTE
MIGPTNLPTQTIGRSVPSSYPRELQYAIEYMNQLQEEHLQPQLNHFWARQRQEIEESTDFKTHKFPLTRIKNIMKANEDVRMVSAEAPVVFAKACEMFIMELTKRAWAHAEENKRKTLMSDILSTISRTNIFDFLSDISSVPTENVPSPLCRASTMVMQRFDPNQICNGLQTHPSPTPIRHTPDQQNSFSNLND